MTPSFKVAPLFKIHSTCRVCQTPLGKPYLDLGEQPLANALTREPEIDSRYPLAVTLCETCGLSQLTVVVDPEILYSGYRFRSGASPVWVQHCEELAKRCTKEFGDFPPRRVLDIAANDGTQLWEFASRGWYAVGVDPEPCWDERYAARIKGFWPDVRVPNEPYDLVIAQNVLGHVDDPIGFLKACKTVLAPEGRIVVEVPEIYPLLHDCAFDTIYHEHLTYWNGLSLEWAAQIAGLALVKAENIDIHGGSMRVWFGHGDAEIPEMGPDFYWEAAYAGFARRVEENLGQTADIIIDDIWGGGYRETKFLGWGAAAKATVYLNAIARHGTAGLPSAIIDETPDKQGLLVPGVHIPIIPPPDDLSDVDVIWILSWNNEQPIKEKARARGFRGKFLLTNGTPRLEA